MAETLDLILFGVTGLVGRYTVKHLLKLTKERNITWGVAGRNEAKIRKVLNDLQKETGDARICEIPIILADMNNQESIETMVSKTKLILNTCGPLRQVGEVVIEACIKFKTNYLDISAEPNFIEKIQMDYDAEAKRAGIYIINSCGVDSIAYDMGVVFVQKNIGTLNSVETYMRFGIDDPKLPGPEFNNSTWRSAINVMAHRNELQDIRRRRYDQIPKFKPKLELTTIPFRPVVDEGWAIPSPSADLSVMRRTQQYMYKEKKNRPVQIESYIMMTVLWDIILCLMAIIMFSVLTKFKLGVKLLLKFPHIFSAGTFGTEEPSKEKLESAWFRITLVGKGWRKKLSGPEDQYVEKPDTKIIARVKGRNPGYGSSSLCLVLAGLVLLSEPQNLPKRGGVFTPGAAYCDTSLIEELNKYGVSFELIKNVDISAE